MKLATAKDRLLRAEGDLAEAVKTTYPIGCRIRYTTAGYDLLYRVTRHGFGTDIFGERLYTGSKKKERRFDGASDMVEFYGD